MDEQELRDFSLFAKRVAQKNQVNACFDFWSDDRNYAAHKEAVM